MPQVSVVTATYNRVDRLRRLVAALEAQTVADLEALVVDDCSTDGTWAYLQEAATTRPWLRPLRMERNGGPARARNAGWRAATAPVIAFTDDDCVPDPAWAERLLAALADPEVDIAQGMTVPDPQEWPQHGPFDHAVQVLTASPMFETCNLAMRRELLEELDGFDERFPFPYGEDADLAWRGRERGARSAFVGEALVTHDVIRRTFRQQLEGERRRISLVTVVRRHPGLRDHLFGRVFYDPTHARLLLAYGLGAAVLAKPTSLPRWAAATGAVAYYGRLRFRWSIATGPAKKWPLWMTQLFVIDSVDVARLARQSAREKTLLL